MQKASGSPVPNENPELHLLHRDQVQAGASGRPVGARGKGTKQRA